MKNFYKGGRGLYYLKRLSYLFRSKNNRSRTLFSFVLSLICVLFSNAQAQSAGERAVIGAEDTKPLQIGDTIPEVLWDLPLRVVNHPEQRDTITLAPYRGKIIVLDFLSTGCAGCIAAIPKLEHEVHKALSIAVLLPVTKQRDQYVNSFLAKNQHTKDSKLPFVVDDHILIQYFPHRYISHLVWIDQHGVLRAQTRSNHFTLRNIQELASGHHVNWPIKAENTDFFVNPIAVLDPSAQMFGNNVKRQLWYTAITGYTEGLGPYQETGADSVMGIERISFRNASILELYLFAHGKHNEIHASEVIWEVDDPFSFSPDMADLQNMSLDQWFQKYGICYERTVPAGTSATRKNELILADLNAFFGLWGRLENRNGVSRFVLSKIKQP